VVDRHALYTHQHLKSKPYGFDKSGAWPIQVNFQPWQQTPVPLGAGSLLNIFLLEPEPAQKI